MDTGVYSRPMFINCRVNHDSRVSLGRAKNRKWKTRRREWRCGEEEKGIEAGGTDRGTGEIAEGREPEEEDTPAGKGLRGKLGGRAEDGFSLRVVWQMDGRRPA